MPHVSEATRRATLPARERVARQLNAGAASVNAYSVGDTTTPFGGFKTSGFGGSTRASTRIASTPRPGPSGSSAPGAELARDRRWEPSAGRTCPARPAGPMLPS
ncbi:MAG: aldehyde dehydrogenase family protein [Chloroflexota bacterium]